jgi:hypothetical protein
LIRCKELYDWKVGQYGNSYHGEQLKKYFQQLGGISAVIAQKYPALGLCQLPTNIQKSPE